MYQPLEQARTPVAFQAEMCGCKDIVQHFSAIWSLFLSLFLSRPLWPPLLLECILQTFSILFFLFLLGSKKTVSRKLTSLFSMKMFINVRLHPLPSPCTLLCNKGYEHKPRDENEEIIGRSSCQAGTPSRDHDAPFQEMRIEKIYRVVL